jgi:hypothetical protein
MKAERPLEYAIVKIIQPLVIFFFFSLAPVMESRYGE